MQSIYIELYNVILYIDFKKTNLEFETFRKTYDFTTTGNRFAICKSSAVPLYISRGVYTLSRFIRYAYNL